MSADPQSSPSSARRGGQKPVIDKLTTVNADGSHRTLFPADVRGRFTTWRRYSAYLLIAIYLLLPWISVRGYPAVFLDVAERQFHFFGFTLAAQDVWLLFFGVSGLGFALFFLTALFGRLWCGWACPQTVFLDHVYRRIERWAEGDAPARRALANAPMTAKKFIKRTIKHVLYIAASLVITHLFLAYFVSIPQLWLYLHEAPAEHWASFLFVFVTAGLLYFNFAWFREQLCIVICPYGRLQSALSDDHTLQIGYDTKRGEPRGKIRHDFGTAQAGLPAEALAKAGACIDCNRCVQVCPTGIDIRHGLQLECIGCAACIDACDEVMEKVHRPKGLIRYDSLTGLGGGITRWIRTRTLVYGVLLLCGAAAATFAFSTVKPASFLVYRMTGAAYFVSADDVRNQFMVRLVNKRSTPVTFSITTEGLPAGVRQTGFTAPTTVASLAETVSPLVLLIDRKNYHGPFNFTVKMTDENDRLTLTRDAEFMGPDAHLLEEEDHEKGIRR